MEQADSSKSRRLESSKNTPTGLESVPRARSDFENLLYGTRIATIFLDSNGNVHSFTPTVRDIYNVTESDIGRRFSAISHKASEMPPLPTLDAFQNDVDFIEHEIQTSESRWFLRRVLPYRHDDQTDGMIVTFVDVSAKKRDEVRLATAYSVAQLLVEAESIEHALPQLLKSLRKTLNAEACSLWLVDSASRELYCAASDAVPDSQSLARFVQRSKTSRFRSGQGLPGRVWDALEPLWVEDVTAPAMVHELDFERHAIASEAGLLTGIAVPIMTGKRFRGVIEFFSNQRLDLEPSLLNMLRDVGHEVGQFIRRKNLDDKLRDEESRRAAILAAALDCVITMDRDGKIVDFNTAAEVTFGYSKSDVVGNSLANMLIPEEQREAHRAGVERYLNSGDANVIGRRVELTAQRADGTQFPVELTISVSHSRDGSPFFTGYLRDITERKAAENVLHKRAELAALHASLAVSLSGEAPLNEILQTCCQHLVDSLDAAFARVWLLQDQVLELAASAGMYTNLDGEHSRIAVGELKIGRIAAQRQPLLTNDVQHDPNIGDLAWAVRENMIAFAGYPLVVENQVVGVVALFAKHELATEVFEQLMPMADAMAQCISRKKTEQGLLDRERRLNLALDAGRLGTWHWEIVTDRVTWSSQLYDLFGYTREQFVQSRAGFLDIIHPDDRDYVTERLDAVFTGTCAAYDMEFRIIRGDDRSIMWTAGRGVIQRDEQNNPVSIVAAANDVTDRKKWELALSDREAHLRRVIDNTLFFIGVLNVDGTLLEANATAINAAAIDRDDVIGKKFWDCYWWNFDQESITRLQEAVRTAATGEVVRYDVLVRMAGDTRAMIDFMLSPIRDESGRITHLIPSGVDITDRKTAENALIQREQHLNLALEAGRMGSWEWDIVADRITWSDHLYELFGYKKHEFTPTAAGFLEIVLPEDRGIVETAINSIMNTRSEREEFECRTVRKNDGQVIVAQCHGLVERDEEGTPLRITGFAADITARKKGETELKDREAHLRRVINNQLGLVGVIDRNGILLEVDDDSIRIAGLTREDVIGKHFAECAWWTYDEAVSERIKEAMEKAFAGEIVRFDVPLFAAGLDSAPDKRLMIDFMLAPVHDENGDVDYLIHSGVDISDRVKAEQAQKDNEERLKMALRAGGMAAWEWNPRESVWTDALYELLGIPADRIASPELFFEHVHPDDLAGLKEAWALATEGTTDYSHEFRIVRPDGEIRWIVGVGEVVHDDSGKVVRIFGLNWDSTNEHAAAEALRTSERKAQLASASKSEFVANMSHEIRTPMTAVLGYAELLLAREDDQEKLKYLRTIQRNGNFLLCIINDILDISKIEAGKLEIVNDWFSVADVVGDVRSMMDVRAAERDLSFEVTFDSAIPEQIESDPKRLRQILINLVGNAIKFTKSGRVRLSVREVKRHEKAKIQFDVVDTGIGMTSEQQDRLFQPFSQGDASVTRAYGGTGLGLAISQRLAGMLGGEITVESESGKGSRFTFTIAAGDVAGQNRCRPELDRGIESVHSPSAEEIQAARLNCRILVVDDRRDVRYLSRSLLTQAGAEVEEAEDGLEAIERLETDLSAMQSIDLILLDMQMPRLDGYQTAMRLRQLGFDKPIVALTADAMQSDMNRCIESGCNEFLSKPIDSAKLLETVTRLTTP